MFELNKLVRKNILKLKPYSSARDEYSGEAAVFLDANENPFNAPFNRYPDPRQLELKEQIGKVKGVAPADIFLGNGSDEAIDLVYRAFCEPGQNNVVAITPTYGMYRVAADINDVEYREVPLKEDFTLDVDRVLNATDANTRLIFMCSPNNPSGNALGRQEIVRILQSFDGIVIVDEAYIDFCQDKSLLPSLSSFPNLIILQTFSKAWGMAGVRLGMAFASSDIIAVLSKIKYPYNINVLTLREALRQIKQESRKNSWVDILLRERQVLAGQLSALDIVKEVYPSDSNFLLVRIDDARAVYEYLVHSKVIVRDRSKIQLCDNCLRITVGSSNENQHLIHSLGKFSQS